MGFVVICGDLMFVFCGAFGVICDFSTFKGLFRGCVLF